MRLLVTLFVGLILPLAGCGGGTTASMRPAQERKAMQAPTEVSKIKVDKAGEVYINGKHAAGDKLSQELVRLRAVKGGVWYYLEDQISPKAREVERTILDSQVPVKITREKFE